MTVISACFNVLIIKIIVCINLSMRFDCMTSVRFTGCADLHLLDMLTPVERKRQGYIHELIVTEENYVNDLQLVTEVKLAGNHSLISCRLAKINSLVRVVVCMMFSIKSSQEVGIAEVMPFDECVSSISC